MKHLPHFRRILLAVLVCGKVLNCAAQGDTSTILVRNEGSLSTAILSAENNLPRFVGSTFPGVALDLLTVGWQAGSPYTDTIQVVTDGTGFFSVSPRRPISSDFPIIFVKYVLRFHEGIKTPGKLIESLCVSPPRLVGGQMRAIAEYTIEQVSEIEFRIEKEGEKNSWKITFDPIRPLRSAFHSSTVDISLCDAQGNVPPPGRYRISLLARNSDMTDIRRGILLVPEVRENSSSFHLAGQTQSPGYAAPQGLAFDHQKGNSSGNESSLHDNGVRDHGNGDGRDGHGKGKGNSENPQ